MKVITVETKQTIRQQLEAIAGEICDHYCKFPDQYDVQGMTEDEFTEKLVKERCAMCPLVQFLSE